MVQPRVQHQIQQQIQGVGSGLRWNQDVVVNVIESGGGIAVAAHRFNAQVEFPRPQPLAALEHHVLEEVGHAALPGSLEHTAGPAPEVEADQGGVGQGQIHHAGAVG